MSDVIIAGDYASIFTGGWFMVQTSGGGGPYTLPAVTDVRYGIVYGTSGSEISGTCYVPSPDYVLSGIQVDASIGNMTLPLSGDVKLNVKYGTSGLEFTGSYDPTATPILSSDDYDSYTKLPAGNAFVATSGHDNEWLLYDLLETEAFNKFGVELTYFVSTYDVNYNKIFGEDNNRRYTRKFNVMGYYVLPKELEIWSKFGIEGLDNFQMFISKRHYRAAVTEGSYVYDVPRVGDVIQAGYNGRFYEIIDVGEEEEIFLQKKHSWVITVQVFKDEKVIIEPSLSADLSALLNYTNQTTDLFDVSATVDAMKPDILFSAGTGDSQQSGIWGTW